jgi:hypothetical protein
MMNKPLPIPPTVKHLDCPCKILRGSFGPHKAKMICVKHNAFVQWVSKDFDHLDIDEYIVEKIKLKTAQQLFENGNVFDKIKYSYTQPKPGIIERIKMAVKKLEENRGK